MLPKNVADYLQSHRQEHLSDLKELLRIPSIANVPGEANQCRRCAQWLVDWLKGIGLEPEILETKGMPVVLASVDVDENLPRLLIYGHYDVQPPDPLDEWESAPFEPEVRDDFLYARGTSDDKGQLFAHLMAIEAWLKAGGGLPLNVTILLEGEEEIGSPSLEDFLSANASRLAADAAVISDSAFFADGLASITCALRGLICLELTVTGPRQDLHSGINGGVVTNPLNALAAMVAAMHDENGRITIPGFYDDVEELTESQRSEWASLPFDADELAQSLGVDALGGGEAGLSVLERNWARPSLDCHGIVGGYVERGSKTVIPARATAKISCRTVANQHPDKIIEGFRQFARDHAPAGVKADVHVHAAGSPVTVSTDNPIIQAGREALEEVFGKPVAMVSCGASIPVTEVFQRLLGLETLLIGFGLPGDNLHSPNERFALKQLWGGSKASAAMLAHAAKLLARAI